MVFDLLKKILSHAENPGELGNYITTQIRELIDAKRIVLLQYNDDVHSEQYSIIGQYPEPIPKTDELRLIYQLAGISQPMHKTTFIEHNNPDSGITLPHTGSEEKTSILTPLEIGASRIGLLLINDVSDRTNLSSVIDALDALSGVLALELKNANFYLKLEREVEKRTTALRDSELYNQLLFDQSNIGLVLCRLDGKLININPSFAKMIGRTAEEILQLSIWDITPGRYRTQDEEILSELTKIKKYGPYEKEYIHRDGHLVQVMLKGVIIEQNGEPYIWSSVEDISERKLIENTQSFLLKSDSFNSNQNFFGNLAQYLAETLQMEYICIDTLHDDLLRAKTLAIYHDAKFEEDVEYSLEDTPCASVVGKNICCFPEGVRHLFPHDLILQNMLAESYLGCTLWGSTGKPVGLIACISRKQLTDPKLLVKVLEMVSTKAAGEIERMKTEMELRESKNRYDLAMHASKDGIYDLNLKTNAIYYSPAWKKMLGYNENELENDSSTWEKLINPDDSIRSKEMMNEVFSHKRDRFELEFRMKHKQGHWVDILSRANAIFDDTGTAVRIVGTNVDISELKIAEKEVYESERRFTEMMKNVNLVSLILDVDGRISFCNDYLLNLTGYTEDEILGKDWFGLFIPEDCSTFVKQIFGDAVAKNQLSLHIENEILTKKGERRLISWNNTILRDNTGKVTGAASLGEDITSRKQAETDLFISESKFRALVESSSDLIWETNVEGVYTYVSPQIQKILGYNINEILTKSPSRFVVEEQRSELEKISASIIVSAIPFNSLVNKYLHKNGEIVYMETSGIPFFDEKGTLIGYRGISRDITERKINEETILRFKKIFDVANFGAVLATTTGRLVYVNNYFAECHGFTNQNLIGEPLSIFHTPDQFMKIELKIEELLQNGKIDSVEMMHHHQNGTDFPMLMNGLVLYTENGRPEFLVATAIDVTESKLVKEEIYKLNEELEQRVANRTAQLEAANKELEAFSYSVSHDLRAPLRHIHCFINLILENKNSNLTNDELEYLHLVLKSAMEMGELIDALLSFSRLNKTEIQKTRIDSEPMLEQLQEFFSEEFKTRTIKVKINELPPITGDYQLIRQVWMNLFSNAVKYTGKKENAAIEIGSFEQDSETVFFIKDNGAGFNMKYENKLFNVFQRLHKTRDFEGIGIGLANVNRIITKHGGRCWATGEPDRGATFYFSLPQNNEK